MKLLIVVHHRLPLWNVPPWFGERLAQDFPQLEVILRDSYEGIEEHLRDAEIIFTISLRPEQLALARALRWIHAPTAAVHQFMFPELIDSDIVLTNSREVHGPVVAEHVMALIFALAKKIPQAVLFQQKRVWGQEAMWTEGIHLQELAGSTLGLIGVGSIGRRVAQMASAMGMRVIAVREHIEKGTPEGVAAVFPLSELDQLLQESDFVVVAAPLIEATQRLINASRLAAMKASAYLINVGRGPCVIESALIEALNGGRIAGAALDCTDPEPPPENSPLWAMNNVFITPHTGGETRKYEANVNEILVENLERMWRGEAALRNQIV